MPITPLPTPAPARNQAPADFVTNMDNFFGALPTLITEVDAVAAAMNLNSLSDTSITSNSIDISGNKTFAVSAGKSFLPGQYLNIADTAAPTTNSFLAQIFSYSGTTLVVTPLYIRGSGTKTAWTITHGNTPQPLRAGASKLLLQTSNGRGTTNTKIRRFTTVTTNTATADVTYADSATLGMSITVSVSGLYTMQYEEAYTANSSLYGISRNSSQLSTAFSSITRTDAVARMIGIGTASFDGACASYTGYLAAGDVIRAHISTAPAATGDGLDSSFYLERLI